MWWGGVGCGGFLGLRLERFEGFWGFGGFRVWGVVCECTRRCFNLRAHAICMA